MIFYHIDRNHSLHEGQIVNLVNPHTTDDDNVNKMSHDLFPDGLSFNGCNYIRNLNNPDQNGFVSKETHSLLITWLIETNFEFVRRIKFSNSISRFQAFFALENIEDANCWPKFNLQNSLIWEVSAESNEYEKLDSSLLIGGLFYPTFSYYASREYKFAVDYWSARSSDNPRYEILIKPPIKVLRQISIPSLGQSNV